MTKEELLLTAKPILFNTEMVSAILDGRKTVTRRCVKPQPKSRLCYTFAGDNTGTWSYPNDTTHEFWGDKYRLPDCITGEDKQMVWKPPYHTDDILYVRESVFQGVGHYLDVSGETVCVLTDDFEYYADGLHEKDHWKDKYEHTWMHRRPSIHMPKEAARIFLKVTDVSVEHLQDITAQEAISEGEMPIVHFDESLDEKATITSFIGTWNSTIKKSDLDTYGWDSDPWVWVIEFERIIPDRM